MNKLFLIPVLLLGAILCFTSCEKEALTSNTFALEESTANSYTVESTAKTTSKKVAIYVYWEKTQSKPVVGANVFDDKNVLVGTTNANGYAYFTADSNAAKKYRVVEPNYGKQQASITYPNDFSLKKTPTVPSVEVAAAGWTLTRNF